MNKTIFMIAIILLSSVMLGCVEDKPIDPDKAFVDDGEEIDMELTMSTIDITYMDGTHEEMDRVITFLPIIQGEEGNTVNIHTLNANNYGVTSTIYGVVDIKTIKTEQLPLTEVSVKQIESFMLTIVTPV